MIFLWGYRKDKVYVNNPQIIDALEDNILTDNRTIPHEMFDRVIANFNEQVATVIQRQGAWIEHITN